MNKKGPIAQKILRAFSKARTQKVIDLNNFAASKQTAEQMQQTVVDKQDLADYHPAHALWIYVQNQVSVLGEGLTALSEMDRLTQVLAQAEDDYMPSGPPMSPLTRSYFFFWAFFDAAVGLAQETVGTCMLAMGARLGMDCEFIQWVAEMQASRMGLYVHEGFQKDVFTFRELGTGSAHTCIVPSGYRGMPGQIWLARILPSPMAARFPHGVMITTPYIIVQPGLLAWQEYLSRTLPKVKRANGKPYEQLMKYGLNARYWNEYIFEAYANHTQSAIFLQGLPDIDTSRPHSEVSSEFWDAAHAL